ncbi:MAG: UvrD-helicase domain-containing protein [Rickettsiaceae bacterium]|nr:UvrD-helicase domain-containing protein [Rickettsiaceae bacterium]
MSFSLDNLSLNEKQYEAVTTTDGPLLVLAGAGTGKTRVLTCRIAHILSENLANAHEIMAVTFTNKAAREMQSRIRSLTHNISALPNVGTFHSIASQILRKHASLVGLTEGFTIIDQSDQNKIIKNILEENWPSSKDFHKKILHIISRWKDAGFSTKNLPYREVKTEDQSLARKVYVIYQARLKSSNVCDFGDLILYNTEIFREHTHVLESLQNQFKYILIDEYQDTNSVQYFWAKNLAQKSQNICCVGDDDQSIYSWRGAEVTNILRFEEDFPGAKIIALEQNYRSSHHILKGASSLIQKNNYRHNKTLWTEDKTGDKINIIQCSNDKEEAQIVTNYILNEKFKKDSKMSEIAILVRASFQTRLFEEAFVASHINYKIVGGLKFYDRQEIKDIIAYLKLTINPSDDIAFERVINEPKRSIGKATIAKIRQKSHEINGSMLDGLKLMTQSNLLSAKLNEQALRFLACIDRFRIDVAKEHSVPNIITKILDETGYKSMLKLEKTEESKNRLENLNELIRASAEYDSVQGFIEHISLVMDTEEQVDFDNVNLITLHSAKGLEFETVFIPGMEEGLFPHQKTINEEGRMGLEEERRLAYVGITRAKRNLYLLHAESRRIFHEYVRSAPSRFLSELSSDSVNSKKTNYFGNRFLYNNSKLASGSFYADSRF